MSATNLPPISAESVAAKIEQIVNFEQPELFAELEAQPRFSELLWFLQFVSQPDNYTGGLTRFCRDFLATSETQIGTSHMLRCRAKKSLSFEDIREVYHECSPTAQLEFRGDLMAHLLFDMTDAELKSLSEKECKSDKARAVAEFTPERLRGICMDSAQRHLAGYFKRLCEQPNVGFGRRDSRDWTDDAGLCTPWYFANVADALLGFIDRRKETLASRLAETEITKLVFEWMSVACETRRAVVIEGNSRFGKTEAIKLWCDMSPGVARLVNTPATNAVGDLLREVARALGIDSAIARRGVDLRERIDYVLRYSNLLLCFDESNFLLPGSYSKNTAPPELGAPVDHGSKNCRCVRLHAADEHAREETLHESHRLYNGAVRRTDFNDCQFAE